MSSKLAGLKGWFAARRRVLVSVSGGVDSGLVAYAAYSVLGDDCTAVTADYQTLAAEELESARRVCSEIGIRHRIISYSELDSEEFSANDQNRCFYCRTELGRRLEALGREGSFDAVVDGTNLDDLGDFRPGIRALRTHGIQSPLVDAGLDKKDVRDAARAAGLSVHDRPSNSCLASRIPWGQRVTAERLARIEMGEIFVRQATGARQVRVRDVDGTARIELGRDELDLLSDQSRLEGIRNRLGMIGFSSVVFDMDGYAPGKLNVV